MKKSDLKNGYVVDLRFYGCRRIVLFDELLIDGNGRYEKASSLIEKYKDDLTHRSDSNLDIMKVYDEEMNLIWERKETDWNKVPFGTRVACWNSSEESPKEGRFLRYDCKGVHKFAVITEENHNFLFWKNCKLIEQLKREISYKEMLDEFSDYCDKHYNENQTCNGCQCYDGDGFCKKENFIDNTFTITRK